MDNPRDLIFVVVDEYDTPFSQRILARENVPDAVDTHFEGLFPDIIGETHTPIWLGHVFIAIDMNRRSTKYFSSDIMSHKFCHLDQG